MNEALVEAVHNVFGRIDVLLIVVSAAVYGIFVGAIPGLTATMAVALFVPMAYWLDPVSAIAAIVTMVACAIFAGDLPTVFLRIPGTPASAAYADAAYRLTRKGLAEQVLGISLTCSVVGGIAGAIVLMLVGAQLAKVAKLFSVTEYLWLYVIGLNCAVLVSSGTERWKAVFSLLIGLLLSTVGLSAAHAEPRFTFGTTALYQGISFIPAMIGLFGLAEVFGNMASTSDSPRDDGRGSGSDDGGAANDPPVPHSLRQISRDACSNQLRRLKTASGRYSVSGLIGVLVGMLPGAGADIAAWVAFAAARRTKTSTDDDQDSLNAIADAATANSSALAGSWIPALVFGIPGDSVTAIVIGVLMMKNVTPGPSIFENQASLVFSIYLIFLLANLVMLPVGLLAIRLGGIIVRIRKQFLLPLIVLFCVTGAYALNSSLADVIIMLVMGLLGTALARGNFPAGPVVLGLILGSPLEERLMQALTAANGNPLGLFNRPLACALALVAAAMFLLALRSSVGFTRQTDADS
ncbi:MAG: tripartite tricarboxylate transporter permease [Planctomycetaceae bacterium]|nr:tripartite tricarboxylate transporter permease [Planctomycetaceae bacterium]